MFILSIIKLLFFDFYIIYNNSCKNNYQFLFFEKHLQTFTYIVSFVNLVLLNINNKIRNIQL